MLFDIRNTQNARSTIERLTRIPYSKWMQEDYRYDSFECCDDYLSDVVKKYSGYVPKFCELEIVFSHITTSNTACASIRQNGLCDLAVAYTMPDCELRLFLEQHGVDIRLDSNVLKYDGKYYDISHDECPSQFQVDAYNAWRVGRRFYYDFCVNGFLSVSAERPYGGNVHARPEVLKDIDRLLHTRFSHEWEASHQTFEVVAKVSSRNVIFDGNSTDEFDRTYSYLCLAYWNATGIPDERILLCKDHVQIPAKDIIEINEFHTWD